MLARKHINAGGEGIKVCFVVEEADSQLFIAVAGATLIGEKEVFGKGVRLVPIVGDVSFFT